MRVLFWVPYPKEGASNRFRVEQYLPYLKDSRISYTLKPFWSGEAYKILYKPGHYFQKIVSFIRGSFSRLIDVATVFRYDIVFVHRESYPIGGAFLEKLVWLSGRQLIFDFDDAIYLPASSNSNKLVAFLKNPAKVKRIIKLSSKVIVGNTYLKEFALRYNRNVTVIPTSIDTEKFGYFERAENEKIVIGWMGSITTLDFLGSMKGVFISLTKKFPNLIFKVVGGDFCISGLSNIISKPWTLENELVDLKSFDIGIMPMPENEWTKGKCGFKAILYMSMGIPCVSSAVGINNEIIDDGVNGFLASAEEEWIKKLSVLITDSELRKKFGRAGRDTIEKRYSLSANKQKLIDAINFVYRLKHDRHI